MKQKKKSLNKSNHNIQSAGQIKHIAPHQLLPKTSSFINKHLRHPSEIKYNIMKQELDSSSFERHIATTHIKKRSNISAKPKTQSNTLPYQQRELLASLSQTKLQWLQLPCSLTALRSTVLKDPLINTQQLYQSLKGFLSEQTLTELLEILSIQEKKTFGIPSIRKQTQVLNEWINSILQKIKNKENSHLQKLEDALVAYNICLEELIREVTVNCLERGMLLKRVIQAYFSLMMRSVKFCNQVASKSKQIFQKKKKSLNHKFCLKQKKVQQSLENSKIQSQNINFEIKRLNLEVKWKNEQIQKLKESNKSLQVDYQRKSLKIIRVQDQNRNLKILLEKVLVDVQNSFPGVRRMKEQEKLEFRQISNLLVNDPVISLLYDGPCIQLNRIQMENKRYLQKLKENMKKESVKQEKFYPKYEQIYTQTDFCDFIIPLVDIEKSFYQKEEKIENQSQEEQSADLIQEEKANQQLLIAQYKKNYEDSQQELLQAKIRIQELESILEKINLKKTNIINRKKQQAKRKKAQQTLYRRNSTITIPSNNKPNQLASIVLNQLNSSKTLKNTELRMQDLMSLIKQIQIYIQTRISVKNQKLPISSLIHQYFEKNNPQQSVCQTQFYSLLAACEKYQTIPLVRLFRRFLGLSQPLHLDQFILYYKIKQFFKYSVINDPITKQEIYPISQCFFYLFQKFHRKISKAQLKSIKDQFEIYAQNQVKLTINSILFVQFIIKKQQQFLELQKERIQMMFNAADLNNDKFLQIEEFTLLFQKIEPEKFKNKKIEQIFNKYSDLKAVTGTHQSNAISYQKFCQLSAEKKLFSLEKQEKAFQVGSEHQQKFVMQAKEMAQEVTNELAWRYKRAFKFGEFQKEMLRTLRQQMKEESSDKKMLFWSFKLLECDSMKKVIEQWLKEGIPSFLFQVNLFSGKANYNFKQQIKQIRYLLQDENRG